MNVSSPGRAGSPDSGRPKSMGREEPHREPRFCCIVAAISPTIRPAIVMESSCPSEFRQFYSIIIPVVGTADLRHSPVVAFHRSIVRRPVQIMSLSFRAITKRIPRPWRPDPPLSRRSTSRPPRPLCFIPPLYRQPALPARPILSAAILLFSSFENEIPAQGSSSVAIGTPPGRSNPHPE